MSQHYIGVKQVFAWPEEQEGQPGYAVRYPDGYISWSPKETFEQHYLPMGEDNDGSKITEEMVARFIGDQTAIKQGEKTTVVTAQLGNGFEIVESSSCVDPANFDMKLGRDICQGRVRDQVWKLLGFLLQSARHGVQAK